MEESAPEQIPAPVPAKKPRKTQKKRKVVEQPAVLIIKKDIIISFD